MSNEQLMQHMLQEDPPTPAQEALTVGQGRLERVRVTRANGEVFDLGRPGTAQFERRLAQYKRSLNG